MQSHPGGPPPGSQHAPSDPALQKEVAKILSQQRMLRERLAVRQKVARREAPSYGQAVDVYAMLYGMERPKKEGADDPSNPLRMLIAGLLLEPVPGQIEFQGMDSQAIHHGLTASKPAEYAVALKAAGEVSVEPVLELMAEGDDAAVKLEVLPQKRLRVVGINRPKLMSMSGTPLPFQPPLPPGPPPANATNLLQLKDKEDLPSDLEALLKERQEAAAVEGAVAATAPPPVPVPAHLQAANNPQWIDCDVRSLDFTVLGKFGVVMVDPPWEELSDPEGSVTDDELRAMDVPCVQDDGVLLLWVTGRSMELGRELLDLWGYKRADELVWVKINQLQRIIRTGRTGHWLNHSKEHCLVGVKGDLQSVNRLLDCDVLVAEVREEARKPDEVYAMLERLSPGTRKLELFGRVHNMQPGWVTVGTGNQPTTMSASPPPPPDEHTQADTKRDDVKPGLHITF